MKGIKKEIITISIIGMSMIFSLTSLAFSWFSEGSRANTSDVAIETGSTGNLLISADTNFDAELNDLYLDIPEDFVFDNVCGDGTNFFYPVIDEISVELEDGSSLKMLGLVGYEDISSDIDKYALILDFYLKIDIDGIVYFDGDTFIDGGGEEPEDKIIAGAMRIAFFTVDDDTGNQDLDFIWIPNPTYEYKKVNRKITYLIDGSVEESYSFATTTNVDDNIIIETQGENSGIETKNGIKFVWGDMEDIIAKSNNELVLVNLTKNTPKHCRIMIWIDGSDRECEKELMGKDINMLFAFHLKETEEE